MRKSTNYSSKIKSYDKALLSGFITFDLLRVFLLISLACIVSFGMPFAVAQSSSNIGNCVQGEMAVPRGNALTCVPIGDTKTCPNGAEVGKDNQGRDVCRARMTSTICADPVGLDDYKAGNCKPYRENQIIFTAEQVENRRVLLGLATSESGQILNPDNNKEDSVPLDSTGNVVQESTDKAIQNRGGIPDDLILRGAPLLFITVIILMIVGIVIRRSWKRRIRKHKLEKELQKRQDMEVTPKLSQDTPTMPMEEPTQPKTEPASTADTDPQVKSEAVRNPSYVILVDTNVCVDSIDVPGRDDDSYKRELYEKTKMFFEMDNRFLITPNVKSELNGVVKGIEKHENRKLDAFLIESVHSDCTDFVMDVVKNQKKFQTAVKTTWVEKITGFLEDINNDSSMEQHRKKWWLKKKKGQKPKYPYPVIMSEDNAKKDIAILARASYFADLAENYKIILLTHDNDFIIFASRISEILNVHVLSAHRYLIKSNPNNARKDPIDEIVGMGGADLDKAYNVLDDDGNALEELVPDS